MRVQGAPIEGLRVQRGSASFRVQGFLVLRRGVVVVVCEVSGFGFSVGVSACLSQLFG